jgi:hypothetical protein
LIRRERKGEREGMRGRERKVDKERKKGREGMVGKERQKGRESLYCGHCRLTQGRSAIVPIQVDKNWRNVLFLESGKCMAKIVFSKNLST